MMTYSEIINNENGPSGRMYTEKYVKNNYVEIYDDIIKYCQINLNTLPFKEKVYHYVNNIDNLKCCSNPNCNNLVKFKNSTIGYYKYCSNKCVSSDPDVKKEKEAKSYEKYGTKAPCMNSKIKNKIIKTNQEIYGFNSPLQNNIIKYKSKKTLFENYGVDNPSKSKKLIDKRTKTFSDNMRIKFIQILQPYGIKDIDYKNKIMYFNCIECKNDFELYLDLFHNRKRTDTILCTHCNPIDSHISGQEIQLQQFIKNNYDGNIIFNDRTLLNPYELDVYLPDLKLAFEFNGLFYHSEKCVENNYHYKKTELSENKGIKLIQIFEDDWTYKKDIIKSMIINFIGQNFNKIYARKTEIREISDNILLRNFLESNHIQGFVGAQIKIGLFYNDDLVSLMTFGKQRKNMGTKSLSDTYELLRFCNKLNTSVIGGASRLFKYFTNNYNPSEIITYADRFFSQGNLYKQLEFEFVHKTIPNYYYIINKSRKNRFNFRKDVLIKQGFDPNKTEKEIMIERKIYRIYDSGQLKFVWRNF
jgi:hypothetical protein